MRVVQMRAPAGGRGDRLWPWPPTLRAQVTFYLIRLLICALDPSPPPSLLISRKLLIKLGRSPAPCFDFDQRGNCKQYTCLAAWTAYDVSMQAGRQAARQAGRQPGVPNSPLPLICSLHSPTNLSPNTSSYTRTPLHTLPVASSSSKSLLTLSFPPTHLYLHIILLLSHLILPPLFAFSS